jgi:hypothetical protein
MHNLFSITEIVTKNSEHGEIMDGKPVVFQLLSSNRYKAADRIIKRIKKKLGIDPTAGDNRFFDTVVKEGGATAHDGKGKNYHWYINKVSL